MSVLIGGLFGTIVMSFAGLAFFHLNMESNTSWNRALNERFERMEERLGTQMLITSTNLSSEGTSLVVTVGNVGAQYIGGFEHMDLLVSYTGVSDEKILKRLRYVDGTTPAAHEWVLTSIEPDVLGRGVLNPGERASLTLMLATAVEPGTYGAVYLATSNGATTSNVFTYANDS